MCIENAPSQNSSRSTSQTRHNAPDNMSPKSANNGLFGPIMTDQDQSKQIGPILVNQTQPEPLLVSKTNKDQFGTING